MARQRVVVGDLSPSAGVTPVARPVETFTTPAKTLPQESDLGNFMRALAPAIEAESREVLKEKSKRDAQLASNKLANQEHQIDMALLEIGSGIADDFTNNSEGYFTKGTKQAVADVTKQYDDYRVQLEESGVDGILLDMFDRKKDVAVAGWTLQTYAPARRKWNLEQQDTKFNKAMLTILNHPDHYESPEDQQEAFRDMYESHVLATGNDYSRVNTVFIKLLDRHVSTTGKRDALYDFAQVAGRDNSSLFNIDKYSDIVAGIENKLQRTDVSNRNAMKSTAESNMLQSMVTEFTSAPTGVRNTALLRIGEEISIDLGMGVTHTFKPTFEDYVPFIEQQHQETLALVSENTDGESRQIMIDNANRDRMNVYIAHNKIPNDIQNNVRNGLSFFTMHNSENVNEVNAAKKAFDALEEVHAYTGGEAIGHILKDEGSRDRYFALRELVRTQVNFNEALSMVNGQINDYDTIKVSYKEIQDGLDKGLFNFTNLDEGTQLRSNAVLSTEVGRLATAFLNVGVASSKEEAINMASSEIVKQYTAVKGTGGQVSLVRLQAGDADKTASADEMEQHLVDLREDKDFAKLIAESFVTDVSPTKRTTLSTSPLNTVGTMLLGSVGLLKPSFDLAYEPSGNPNIANVWAYRDDDPTSITDRVLVGQFNLSKSAFTSAKEFREQKVKELNESKQEDQDVSFLDVLNPVTSAYASAFTSPDLDLAMSNIAYEQDYDTETPLQVVQEGIADVIEQRQQVETLDDLEQFSETDTAFNKFNIIPSNMAQFAGSLLGDTIVETSDLSTTDISLLKNIVKTNLKKGKKTIDYSDYGFSEGGDTLKVGFKEAIKLSTTDPKYRMATLLGASTIKVEDGNVYITDTYDFNKGKKGLELEEAIKSNDIQKVLDVFEGQSFVQGLRTAAYVLQPEAEKGGVKIYLGKVEDFK